MTAKRVIFALVLLAVISFSAFFVWKTGKARGYSEGFAVGYAVGYATSHNPLGPYRRYEANPILSYTSKLYGPGHHSFTVSPDGSELIIVYHIHNTTSTVHPRKICIDRARFAPTDGGREGEGGADRLEIWGPTHVAEAYPK